MSKGAPIQCARCGGHGLVSSWSFGVKEPNECADCGGSGSNWLYPRGAIAKYYSGPLIGLIPATAQPGRPDTGEVEPND